MNQVSEGERVVNEIVNMLEERTGVGVFTIRVLGEQEEGLDVVVVFDDKSLLMGLVSVEYDGDNLACRIRGNYI